MGYSPRYHTTTSHYPNQHSETDDWDLVAKTISDCKYRGDYTGHVIDTHTGTRTDFGPNGITNALRQEWCRCEKPDEGFMEAKGICLICGLDIDKMNAAPVELRTKEEM